MGGVINIITKKQKDEGFHGNAHFMYGSYNTQKYMASAVTKKINSVLTCRLTVSKPMGTEKILNST